jgi:hypothetical protein
MDFRSPREAFVLNPDGKTDGGEMASTASYPARQLSHRRNAWMRRNVRVLMLAVVGVLALCGVVSLLLLTIPMPARLYVLGVTHAGLIAAGLHLVNSAFLAHDQEAVWQMRGAWARATLAANSNGPSASASSGGGWIASNFKPATSTTSL